MFRSTCFQCAMLIAALALAACGGSATPQLIGSYPQGSADSPPPISVYEPAPLSLFIAYNAWMEIEVDDTRIAENRVRSEAENVGGFLLNSRVWVEGGGDYAEMTVAVPVRSFEIVRARLHSLGDVRSESVSGELHDVGEPYGGAENYSHITVSLRPSSANWLKKAGSFLAAVFWVAIRGISPLLTLIGLITVLRAAFGWVRQRMKPQA